ncbi:F-box only protein 13 [Acorus calamus]|uniref:F-box only protein 13 n=1 Tax=Acorus calamus TaxID=4465 RepID=A0AAV9EMC5_ACOCL|nr:F-box only protein 13 [Acorus calamus]
MDPNQDSAMAERKTKTRKRKQPESPPTATASLDELNQDLLERVLSRLPASSFFRLRSVCKRWSSVMESATFRLACSEVPSRDPWFFMVDPHLDRSIVYDTSENNWKNLNPPSLLNQTHISNSMPVASAGGLVCFRTVSEEFVVCNPVTGACRELPKIGPLIKNRTLHAIAMKCSGDYGLYKLVLVFGEFPDLSIRIYDSMKHAWEEEFTLHRRFEGTPDSDAVCGDGETVYFLSKTGEVIATNMQRSPSKQYSSIITLEEGEEVLYFLSSSGTLVGCNLARKSYIERPRILPVYFEYSIDVIECNGEVAVVVLSEFLESASLRVWKFFDGHWTQVAAMNPAMSHEFYGKKADINCVGCGDSIFICVNSGESGGCCCAIMCDLGNNEWVELPKCEVDGRVREFMSAFSFEPRIEACV